MKDIWGVGLPLSQFQHDDTWNLWLLGADKWEYVRRYLGSLRMRDNTKIWLDIYDDGIAQIYARILRKNMNIPL